MGKNHSIYFDDETDSLIGNVEGKGTIINQLVKEYFSNDIEVIQRKLEKVDIERTALLKKLEAAQNEKARKLLAQQQKKALTKEEIKKQELKNKLLEIYREDLITDEQYSSCFDLNGIIESEALKYVN